MNKIRRCAEIQSGGFFYVGIPVAANFQNSVLNLNYYIAKNIFDFFTDSACIFITLFYFYVKDSLLMF